MTSTTVDAVASDAPVAFDPTQPYRCSTRVGLRPEPFGALAYHFDTRRLVFLKAPELVRLVQRLAEHPTVDAAIAAHNDDAGNAGERVRPARTYVAALADLADSGVIEPNPDAAHAVD